MLTDAVNIAEIPHVIVADANPQEPAIMMYANVHIHTVYAAGAAGNVAPIRVIGGPFATNAQMMDAYGIAVDNDGRVYTNGLNSLLVFAPAAAGNVAPERVISHADPNMPIRTCRWDLPCDSSQPSDVR